MGRACRAPDTVPGAFPGIDPGGGSNMPFKFRDLIVDVVSEGVQNLGPVRCITLTCANFTCGFVSPVTCYTHTCGFISKWGCRWSCGFFSPDPCGGFTGGCPAGS